MNFYYINNKIKPIVLSFVLCLFSPFYGQVVRTDTLLNGINQQEFNKAPVQDASFVNLNIARFKSNLARKRFESGFYEEAVELGTESIDIFRKIQQTDHPDYALSLNNLASYCFKLGNYSEAVKLGTEAMNIRKQILGTNHQDYATSLDNLAGYYCVLSNYSEAIKLGTEAMNIRKQILGTNHQDYATSLNNLANYYSHIGNYSEALRLETEAMELYKRVYGSNHPDYAMSLNNLAKYNSDIGNYKGAISLGTEAVKSLRQILGPDHPDYAASICNLASYCSEIGNYSEAIKLGTEAIEIFKRAYDVNLPAYAWSLSNLAFYYYKHRNYSEALSLGMETMEIHKRIYGTNHPRYAATLAFLARINMIVGSDYDAMKLATEAVKICEKTLGVNHPDYLGSLRLLATIKYIIGDYISAVKYGILTTELFSNEIIRAFSSLSSQNRHFYWEKNRGFIEDFQTIAYNITKPQLISLLYDKSALFSKAILLNTEIELKKIIEESGDATLVEEYQKYLANNEIYNKQSNLPIIERSLNVDSLYQVIQKQDDDIIRRSKAYGNYMRNLKFTWKDIQQSLGENDIAIEFLDFPINKDSVMYIALTLKKDYDNPRMIPLFELKQLKRINENTYYRSSRLSNLVWGPLMDELSNVKDVYFSPSGELHKIGIEYLPLSGDKYIFDKHKMHRLSSTRQIAIDKKKQTRKQAVLYGGIDYDTPLAKDLPIVETANEMQMSFIDRMHVDSLSIKGSRTYLEGTKIEADNISENLKRHRWNFTYYAGDKGTEENFKMMNGNSPSLLHIATHGFYMTEEDARKEQELAMLETKRAMIDQHHVIREDKPMTRSGLLLSGCNHALNHEAIPGGREDGILTAQEIASMDLRGLDLVVLSACETGLGDISSGEGVFGLQRGFKKAGANTIIMSLWKVSDKATETLMTSFYQHYLDGMSKEDAFTTAREELRKVSPQRQNKPDWAAFIMLDGIN